MTTRAYDESYLDDAMDNLGDMFDYAIIDCGYNCEEFFTWFLVSGVARAFEMGAPRYVAGLSGPELASEVIYRTRMIRPDVKPSENTDKSAEYWAGWSLAYFQWYSAGRFSDIYRNGLTITRILSLYPTLHEADISKFVTVAEDIIHNSRIGGSSNLQRIRKAAGLTQKGLADKSGTSLRMIQLYEQRRQDINKAQAVTVAGLARVLRCSVDNLLETGGR